MTTSESRASVGLDASLLIAHHLNPADQHEAAATAILLAETPGHLLGHRMTLAEVLVDGVRAGGVRAMRADLMAAGIDVGATDDDEPPLAGQAARREWPEASRLLRPFGSNPAPGDVSHLRCELD